MKSKWRVTSNPIDGRTIFTVFRIRDTAALDHSGNRESAPGWHDNREDAQRQADELNKEDKMEQIKRRLAVMNSTVMTLEDECGVLRERVKEKEEQIKAWKLVVRELTDLDKEFGNPVVR